MAQIRAASNVLRSSSATQTWKHSSLDMYYLYFLMISTWGCKTAATCYTKASPADKWKDPQLMVSHLSPSLFSSTVLTDTFTATYGNVSTPVFTRYKVHTASQHTANRLSSQHHSAMPSKAALRLLHLPPFFHHIQTIPRFPPNLLMPHCNPVWSGWVWLQSSVHLCSLCGQSFKWAALDSAVVTHFCFISGCPLEKQQTKHFFSNSGKKYL